MIGPGPWLAPVFGDLVDVFGARRNDSTPDASAESSSTGAQTWTIHALIDGRALCGFADGDPPAKWPAGHAWARPADYVALRSGDGLVTCLACDRPALAEVRLRNYLIEREDER